jgi:hypothetical protein
MMHQACLTEASKGVEAARPAHPGQFRDGTRRRVGLRGAMPPSLWRSPFPDRRPLAGGAWGLARGQRECDGSWQ